MKYFFKSMTFKLILGTVLICAGVFVYSYMTPNNNIFEDILSGLVIPVQKTTAKLVSSVLDFSYQFKDKEELKAQNEQLQHELNNLRDKTADYYSVKRENLRLKKYYGLKSTDKKLKFASANVIGAAECSGSGLLMLDCGRNSGIEVGNAVVTDEGFFGSVSKVNANSCYVKTIILPGANVGAEDQVTGDTGIINGSDELCARGLSRMTFVPAQNNMACGDIVCTSGVSGIYPKGLKIGEVQAVNYDNRESFYYAVIKPFQDVKSVRHVFVITDFTGKGEFNLK